MIMFQIKMVINSHERVITLWTNYLQPFISLMKNEISPFISPTKMRISPTIRIWNAWESPQTHSNSQFPRVVEELGHHSKSNWTIKII
jgi:hypothetical protein